MLISDSECLHEQTWRRLYGQERFENCGKVFFRGDNCEGFVESGKRYIEEFLHDLIADDALLGRQGLADQLGGRRCFRGGASIEGIDEDIRIQKESIAHSILPG